MTYKTIPFTLEEWRKDPEGRKINCKNVPALVAHYFPDNEQLAIIWEDGDCNRYSIKYAEDYFTLLIPVKTVRKWKNIYTDEVGFWHDSLDECDKACKYNRDRFAILSAEFDEDGNYIKGSVKVEEV